MTATSNAPTAPQQIDYTLTIERARDLTERVLKAQPKRDYDDAFQYGLLLATTPIIHHPDTVRVSPNELLRCGLFRVADSRREREYLFQECLPLQASRGGCVMYTGLELRQDDCAAFMELLHLEQATPGVAIVHLRRTAAALGWGTSNAAVERLEGCIIRMRACNLEVRINLPLNKGKVQTVKHGLSLISEYKSTKKGTWVVYMPQEIRWLCGRDRHTRVAQAYAERLTKNSSMASWLLRFYSTHRDPMPLTYEQLREYCCASAEPKELKRMVKAALEQLKSIGFLRSYTAGAQDVSVVRSRVLPDEVDGLEESEEQDATEE